MYMGAKPAGDLSPSALHSNILQQAFGRSTFSCSFFLFPFFLIKKLIVTCMVPKISPMECLSSSRASSSLVRSYGRSFNGFVAKLTEEEMQLMKGACVRGWAEIFQ